MRFDKISDQLLYIFFQITFCVNIWFVLKQLDNEPEGGGGRERRRFTFHIPFKKTNLRQDIYDFGLPMILMFFLASRRRFSTFKSLKDRKGVIKTLAK